MTTFLMPHDKGMTSLQLGKGNPKVWGGIMRPILTEATTPPLSHEP